MQIFILIPNNPTRPKCQVQFHDCTISQKRSCKDTDRRIDDVQGEIEGIDGGYAKRLWQKSGNGSDGNVVDRNVPGDDIGKSRPMKDRIDDLPFSQDWPDRATSSTLQRRSITRLQTVLLHSIHCKNQFRILQYIILVYTN